MKIENQVCTLEQAKTLESLGVNAKSAFYWHFDSGMKWRIVPEGYFYEEEEGVEYFPAYNTGEIGQALPVKILNKTLVLNQWNGSKEDFRLQYRYIVGTITDCDLPADFIISKSEAHARAEMLIWLLQNNHITVEQINERLSNS